MQTDFFKKQFKRNNLIKTKILTNNTIMNNDDFLYKRESSEINGAVYEVHKIMGVGLLEKVYQEALALEFIRRDIPFEQEKPFRLAYKGTQLNAYYVADFVCYGKIIVELKSVSELLDIHKAQVRNYLSITGYELGLLYNFNDLYMKPTRILNPNNLLP